MIYLCKKVLERIGLCHERLQIGWISSSEGTRFAKVISDFTMQIKELGPLGKGKGEEARQLRLKMETARSLVSYVKLVEINKMRLPLGIEGGYEAFFSQGETRRMFEALIADELITGEILLLLKERDLSVAEISEDLGLSLSEVSGCLYRLAKKGLIRVDSTQRRFVHTAMQEARVETEK